MDPIKLFQVIVKKERLKEIIPFLKSLSPEQRRLLAPEIIALEKEYSKFVQTGNSWGSKQTQAQRSIFIFASIVCFNRKEFSKIHSLWALDQEHLSEILPWYVPSWLGDFMDSELPKASGRHSLHYEFALELIDAGIIQPQPELLATLIVPYILEYKSPKSLFRPEKLLKRPESLSAHIWYVFSYQTSISFSNSYTQYEGYEKGRNPTWIDVFVLYVKEGRLGRIAVLRESLLAANRNFDKILSGWFAELFVALEPTVKELLQLQPELFSLLNAPHSKPVGTSLNMLKKIPGEDGFEYNNFLEYLPVLTSSPVKANIASCLSISEAIWKKNKSLAAEIAPLVCGVFIIRDEAIQLRAAKLLLKFSKTAPLDIAGIVAGYSQTLLTNPKSILRPLTEIPLIGRDSEQEHNAGSVISNDSGNYDANGEPISNLVPLPAIESFEDFVFLISQVLDNNESWHLDQAAAGLIKFQSELNGDKIKQLLPAFQRAWKYLLDGWSSGAGYLDYMFASFMIDVGMVIIKRHATESVSLRNLYDQNLEKFDVWQKQWHEHGTNLSFFTTLRLKTSEKLYDLYKKFLDMALDRFKRRIGAPLLSTPTGAPGWLDPNVLIERLREYKQWNIEPDNTDFQLAISRCRLDMITPVTLIEINSLPLTYRNLLAFLFNQEVGDATSMRHDSLWVTAAIVKDPEMAGQFINGGPYDGVHLYVFTGQYPWRAFVEDYQAEKYEYTSGRLRTSYYPAKRNVLRLQYWADKKPITQPAKTSVLKSLFNKAFGSRESTTPASLAVQLIWQYYVLNSNPIELLHNDARRLIMMTPNNPESLIAVVIHKGMVEAPFAGELVKRLAIAVLQAMVDLSGRYKETSHVFIAGCMTGNDKTVASYAAELWMKAVQDNSLSSERLGYILGCLYAIEYAPMKRFTDLVINQLFNVSPLHNQKLEQLLTSMILQLPEQPVKGLKRLLEIFFEVVSANGSVVREPGTTALFAKWHSTTGLQKVISGFKVPYPTT